MVLGRKIHCFSELFYPIMENHFLQNIYQYPTFGNEDLKIIFDFHQKVSFKKGEYFLKNGQIANEYFCLEKGLVRSYVIDYQGNDITTAFFSNSEIVIDVVSLFQRTPARENLQALTECEVWKIDFDKFQYLFQSIEGFSEWGRNWMTQTLFQLKQRSIEMLTDTAKDRYLALQAKKPQIIQFTPLKHIASYLGITDTSLSRIRKELAQSNF
jgi:CRP-like cAMP-binding protein